MGIVAKGLFLRSSAISFPYGVWKKSLRYVNSSPKVIRVESSEIISLSKFSMVSASVPRIRWILNFSFTNGNILSKLRLIAFNVLWSLYCGFCITTEVPLPDTLSKEICSSVSGTSKLLSFIWRDNTNPDFSPFEIVFIRTFSETDRAASFPTPLRPIFFRFIGVRDSASVFLETAATLRYFWISPSAYDIPLPSSSTVISSLLAMIYTLWASAS